MNRVELILYATPRGPLADQLDELFTHLRASAATTAQDYPPHCTLTGFFHRTPDTIPRICEEVGAALRAATEDGALDVVRVEVVALHRQTEWVGLELTSPWLEEVIAQFIAGHELLPGDDALRPKDWLHTSIAYGVDDLGPAAHLAADFDHRLPATWEVGLWQRHGDGAWSRHPSEAGQ